MPMDGSPAAPRALRPDIEKWICAKLDSLSNPERALKINSSVIPGPRFLVHGPIHPRQPPCPRFPAERYTLRRRVAVGRISAGPRPLSPKTRPPPNPSTLRCVAASPLEESPLAPAPSRPRRAPLRTQAPYAASPRRRWKNLRWPRRWARPTQPAFCRRNFSHSTNIGIMLTKMIPSTTTSNRRRTNSRSPKYHPHGRISPIHRIAPITLNIMNRP